MDKLKKAYADLYDSICTSKFKEGFCEGGEKAEYSTFTAIEGHKFRNTTDKSGSEFRFMLVGRAGNGWNERGSEYITKQVFVDSSIANITNSQNVLLSGKDRFEWIITDNNNYDIAFSSDDENYLLAKSPFWNYSKPIWSRLSGADEEVLWSSRWFENIVWSNLYKIAPIAGANPPSKLCKVQKDTCKELLKSEINYFKPTHIFFVTGRDSWFCDFSDIFDEVTKEGTNISRGEGKNKEYVEATCKFGYPDGTYAKAVVACRPERRDRDGYVDEVCSFFNKI